MLHASGSDVVRMRRVRGESAIVPSLVTCVPLKSPRKKSTGELCDQRKDGRARLVPLSTIGVGVGVAPKTGVGDALAIGVAIGVGIGTLGVGFTISEADGAIGFCGVGETAPSEGAFAVDVRIKPPRDFRLYIEYSIFGATRGANEFNCNRERTSAFEVCAALLSGAGNSGVLNKRALIAGGKERKTVFAASSLMSLLLADESVVAGAAGVVTTNEVVELFASTLLLLESGADTSLCFALSTGIASSCKPPNEYSRCNRLLSVSLKAAMPLELPRNNREKLAGGEGTRLLSTTR